MRPPLLGNIRSSRDVHFAWVYSAFLGEGGESVQ